MPQIHFHTATENRVKIDLVISRINIRIAQMKIAIHWKNLYFTHSFPYWLNNLFSQSLKLSKCVSQVCTEDAAKVHQSEASGPRPKYNKLQCCSVCLLKQQSKTNGKKMFPQSVFKLMLQLPGNHTTHSRVPKQYGCRLTFIRPLRQHCFPVWANLYFLCSFMKGSGVMIDRFCFLLHVGSLSSHLL